MMMRYVLVIGAITSVAHTGCSNQAEIKALRDELADLKSKVTASTSEKGSTESPPPVAADLKKEIDALKTLVPDQAAVMTKVGYHFNALWYALEKENWPLAEFYLSEAMANLRWGVRAKPVRKDSAGRDVKLQDILQALENSQLNPLKTAVKEKDKTRCLDLYRQTLQGCYSCHKASDKPYLRPKTPTHLEAGMIEFDPGVKWPM